MSEISEIEKLGRKLAAKERTITRHIQFRMEAEKHIPTLIAGDRSSPKWDDAVNWWSGCAATMVQSSIS